MLSNNLEDWGAPRGQVGEASLRCSPTYSSCKLCWQHTSTFSLSNRNTHPVRELSHLALTTCSHAKTWPDPHHSSVHPNITYIPCKKWWEAVTFSFLFFFPWQLHAQCCVKFTHGKDWKGHVTSAQPTHWNGNLLANHWSYKINWDRKINMWECVLFVFTMPWRSMSWISQSVHLRTLIWNSVEEKGEKKVE